MCADGEILACAICVKGEYGTAMREVRSCSLSVEYASKWVRGDVLRGTELN